MNNLVNPSGICPDNEYIVGIQENVSSDNTLGGEAIGQYIKTNGKLKGISHVTRMPITVDPTQVPQIHFGFKRKVHSAYIKRGNPN